VFSLTELGKRLREARQEKNMSLEELQTITKIQKRYLHAIEEGNYKTLPGSFYVRAFIKQYAEAVGLDPEVLFEEYKNDVPDSHDHDIPEQLSRVKSRQQVTPEMSRFIDYLPKILGALLLVGGIFAAWLLLVQYGDEDNGPKNGAAQNQTEVEQPENSPLETVKENDKPSGDGGGKAENDNKENEAQQDEPTSQENPTFTLNVLEIKGRESTVELTNADQLVLELTSKGNSWVEVRNGKGHSFYANSLKQNETQQFDLSKESEVLLKIGNALDVEVKINGQPFPYPIDPNKEVFQKINILYKKS